MQDRALSLEEALKLAHEAKDYARSKIKKGSTQLENNKLSQTYFDFLSQGVHDVRTLKTNAFLNSYSHDPLELNQIVMYYEKTIAISAKYSLGNCDELAFHALDYLLNYAPSTVNAEVYFITCGDHVMLVINRDPNSNPQNPKTWGDNAVICDPWSNKVFKACDYLTEVKTFERDWGQDKIENCVDDFNPKKHQLMPKQQLNSSYLRQHRTVAKLKENFARKINHIIQVIINYKESLVAERDRLREKYGDQDQRIAIISEKIKMIESDIQITRDDSKLVLDVMNTNDYRLAKKELLNSLYLLTAKATNAMQFTANDLKVLTEHKGKDKKTDIMKFFGMKSTTHAHIKIITENTNRDLRMNPG